jgi:alanine dehydrogenase
VLVLPARDVEALLDLDRLVDAVEQAMIDLSAGRVSLPSRVAAQVTERHAMLAAMPAYLPGANTLVTKLVSLFPDNRDQPTHQAVICCFDAETGTPVALLDGTYITAARTAAGSVVATRLLARPEGRVVAIIGTGVQASSHARAFARRAQTGAILLAGRDHTKVLALRDDLAAAGVAVEAANGIEDAVRSADIICAATHPQQPVVHRDWLKSGAHLNSVGYNAAGAGEIDSATLRDARVAVESRAAVLAPPPSGAVEIQRAIETGNLDADRLVELGELSAGLAVGRTSADQLTVYKSVGVAVQDAAAAALVLEAARMHERGTNVPI